MATVHITNDAPQQAAQQHEAPADAATPKWAASLPCCLLPLMRFFYFDLLVPGDTFEASTRKVLLGIGPIMYVCSPLPNTAFMLFTEQGDSVSGIVALVNVMIWGPLFFGLFIYGKCRPARAGDGILTDIWTLTAGLCLLVTTLTRPTAAWHIPQIVNMLLAVMCRGPRRGPICLLSFLAGWAAVFNRSAYDLPQDPTRLVLAVPDATDRSTDTMRLDMAAFTLTIPVLICLEVILRESDRRHAASRASIELAKRMADTLSRYDTKEAAAALDAAESLSGDTTTAEAAAPDRADAELIAGFRSIVANLNEYRPHLPNWLVNKAQHGAGSGSDAEDEEATTFAGMSVTNHVMDRSFGRASAASRGAVSEKDHRDPRRLSRSDSSAGLRGPRPPLPFAVAASAPHQHHGQQTRTVGLCELDIDITALKPLSADTRAEVLHAFVDKVHVTAQETRAAVHAFVGDALIATWNAASTCAQPEAKAARFAARIRAACARGAALDVLSVTGGVVCGAAHTLMAGLGDQRALLVSPVPAVASALRAARACAAKRSAILVPAALAKSAQYAAHFQLAAVVQADGAPSTLHAVVGEVCDGGDEWMYVLDDVERSDANALAECARACEQGDFAAALCAVTAQAAVDEECARLAALKSDLKLIVEAAKGIC